nr:Chain C, Ser-ala-glu-pro-val-pro-leu-gln-leu [Human immunodeficiency virus 1]
SAEPVPLQL